MVRKFPWSEEGPNWITMYGVPEFRTRYNVMREA